VAEVLAAGLARLFDLPMPEPAIVVLERDFGKGEPDPEIQDILRGSVGENFGLGFLPGALAFDPAVDLTVDSDLAAAIVWFDAFITNVDRTVRNTNLLIWHEQVWLIDHGATLYFHHNWKGWESQIQSPFPLIKNHVLLHVAGDLTVADRRLCPLGTEDAIRAVVADVPEAWLDDEPAIGNAARIRDAYVTYLTARLNGPRDWLQEAIDAQSRGPERLARRLTHRVV
jgi:hypothetical protein